MDFRYVNLILRSSNSSVKNQDELEKEYQLVYKPLIKFLYSHPDFSFSFYFNGIQIDYFKRKRKEFINIIKELVNRKQVEILGGGYYDPFFPLISQADRTSQIDMLSSEIRQHFGKRPRGITLLKDCWDSNIINSLQVSGIEYVILHKDLLQNVQDYNIFSTVSVLGKSIDVANYELFTDLYENDINLFIKKIESSFYENIKNRNINEFQIKNIVFEIDDIINIINKKWLEELYTTEKNFEYNTIINCKKLFFKNNITFINSRWHNMMEKSISNIYDYLEQYPESKSIYNKTIYLNMLINSFKNDKMRKKASREKVLQAQNGNCLLDFTPDIYTKYSFRQNIYKILSEAEFILRNNKEFNENISCFDYNNDGLNEYICKMNKYFAYVNLKDGSIQDFEIFKKYYNYTDIFGSNEYRRGMFLDYILPENFYSENNYSANKNDYILNHYTETKFSQNKNEIQLIKNFYPHLSDQELILKKKYIFNSNGMTVQYILRNCSDKTFTCLLNVDSNFINIGSKKESFNSYEIEVISNNTKYILENSNPIAKYNNVDIIRINDLQRLSAFTYEMNENCIYIQNNIKKDSNVENVLSSFLWNISLEPGMETEKSILFTFTDDTKKKLLKK